ALVLQDRLDRANRVQAGDRLKALLVGGLRNGVRRGLEDSYLLAQHDVDVVARLDKEVETGDAVHLEGDRLLAGLQLSADAAGPSAHGFLIDLRALGDV